MENIERLKTIASTPARQLTDDDKAFIAALSADMGVEFKHRAGCLNCYCDQAAVLYNLMPKQQKKSASKKYTLKDGVDVMWRGLRINAATMTDKFAKDIIAAGFPTTFFV